MDLKSIFEVVAHIESGSRVNTWVMGGVRVWPLVRIHFITNLISVNIFKINKQKTKKTNLQRVFVHLVGTIKTYIKYTKAYFLDAANNDKPDCVDALFYGDGVSFEKRNGKYYDKFCDPIVEKLNSNGFSTLLISPLSMFLYPRYTKSYWIQPRLDIAILKSLIFGCFNKKDSQLFDFDSVSEYLEKKGILDNFYSKDDISRQMNYVFCFAEVFEKILIKTKPKTVFMVSYYGNEGLGLNIACRRLGIKSVDIQHGVYGGYHQAYSKWMNLPDFGYEMLPNYFWCWSDAEARILDDWANRSHGSVIGGHPYIEKFHETKLCKSEPAEHIFGDKCFKLLYTYNGLVDDEMNRLISLIKKSIAVNDNLFYFIRMHPCRLHLANEVEVAIQREGLDRFCDIKIATKTPLYSMLDAIDIHITMTSSVVLEAKIFNKPSIIIDKAGFDNFEEYIEKNFVEYAENEDMAISLIASYAANTAKSRSETTGDINSALTFLGYSR